MNSPTFYFAAFEAKLAEYRTDQSPLSAGRWGRRSLTATLLGLFVLNVAPMLLAPSWVLLAVLAVAMAIEVGGIIGLAVIQVRSVRPHVGDRRGEFARSLDREFAVYRDLISWLRGHAINDLRAHLAYVRGHREVMRRKLGLFIGGVERLGILPLLLAFYIQMHDSTAWPPSVSWTQGLTIWMLALTYGIGWWAAGAALRMDVYAQLLSDALDVPSHC